MELAFAIPTQGREQFNGTKTFRQRLEIFDTEEVLRLGNNPAYFASIAVASGGQLTITLGAAIFSMGPVGGSYNQGFSVGGLTIGASGTLAISNISQNLNTGSASTTNAAYLFGTANVAFSGGIGGTAALSTTGGVNTANVIIPSRTITTSTGATAVPIVAGLVIREFATVETSAAFTAAATLYIPTAPTGGTSTKYAAWIDDGAVRIDSFTSIGTAAAPPTTAYLTLGAGTTGISPLRITPGVAPSSPVDGDVYYIDTNDRFMVRKNATDAELLSGSAVTTEALTSDTSITITYNGTTYKLLAKA